MTAYERKKKLANDKKFRRGQSFGIEFTLTVLAWVMVETVKAPAEEVQAILDAMEDFCVDLEKRNINIRDMQEVLKDEHNVTVKFGNRRRGDVADE